MSDINPNIRFCTECGRYYDSTIEHDCRGMEVRLNRAKLERWLGQFIIKEET